MRRRVHPLLVALVAGVAGAAGIAGVGVPASSAVGTYCAALPGLTANEWEGLGVDPNNPSDAWEDPDNWSLDVAPLSTSDPYVCIPTGGLPAIRDGEEAHLDVIDVQAGATLLLDTGSKLFLNSTTYSSTVRGRLEVYGATLGGAAHVDLLGTIRWESPSPSESSTITTRECAYHPGPYDPSQEACTAGVPIAGDVGELEVHKGGLLDITSAGAGVNLGDQYQLLVRGVVRIRNGAYVAADHGTRLQLQPHSVGSGSGVLRFAADGDWVEGKNDFGVDQLGDVVNDGHIEKSGGSGISMVTATYTQPSSGDVTVLSGTLLLPSGATPAAKVAAGRAYGSGRCAVANVGNCAIITFLDDQQNARFRVPSSDPGGAAVVVRELATAPSPGQFPHPPLGLPVQLHENGLSATRSRAAVVTLRYDERLMALRGHASHADVRVYRQATSGGAYKLVVACRPDGRIPSSQMACVDRRPIAAASHDEFDAEGPGGPDAVMVVRTIATSRWIAR